jgi:hypothetical protein
VEISMGHPFALGQIFGRASTFLASCRKPAEKGGHVRAAFLVPGFYEFQGYMLEVYPYVLVSSLICFWVSGLISYLLVQMKLAIYLVICTSVWAQA